MITQWDLAVQEPIAKLALTFALFEITSELILLVIMCLFAVDVLLFVHTVMRVSSSPSQHLRFSGSFVHSKIFEVPIFGYFLS